MSARLVSSVVAALVATLGGGAACQAPSSGPQRLTVTSADYTVSGAFTLLTIDRVNGLRVENRRLVLTGTPADVVLEVPASLDPERPARHWALVTDAHVDGHRLVVFTEAESVKDVSIELPDGEAPLHFDVFATGDGGEILVFATGDRRAGAPSLYGHVTIERK
jgi:hypothetical protein